MIKVITQERLKELLVYYPDTGIFMWREHEDLCRKRHNTVAGYFGAGAVKLITIDKIYYRADKLAFLYMTGKMPKYVKHINGVVSCCKWDNLAETTRAELMDRRRPL